jgi:hypothetical protein
MKTEYKGYTIEAIANQKDGRWTADVWLYLPGQARARLQNLGEHDGYSSADDAVAAGVAIAEAEVDIYLSR